MIAALFLILFWPGFSRFDFERDQVRGKPRPEIMAKPKSKFI